MPDMWMEIMEAIDIPVVTDDCSPNSKRKPHDRKRQQLRTEADNYARTQSKHNDENFKPGRFGEYGN